MTILIRPGYSPLVVWLNPLGKFMQTTHIYQNSKIALFAGHFTENVERLNLF